MTLNVHHVYHLAAGFSWPKPLGEHVDAVHKAELPGTVLTGITGISSDRKAVRDWLAVRWPEAQTAEYGGSVTSETPTLTMAWNWARDHPGGALLYAHAKGSASATAFADAWRESMTIDVVGGWRKCLTALESGEYDAAGPHWLDPAVYPNMLIASQTNGGSKTPYFGGNFWWATTAYLATLPAPSNRTRWDAERWVGLGHPRVLDLRPGWPAPLILTGERIERMIRES